MSVVMMMAIVATIVWAPGLLLGAVAWLASRLSADARGWIGRQLFG